MSQVKTILEAAYRENPALLNGLGLAGPPFSVASSVALLRVTGSKTLVELIRRVSHHIDANRRQLEECDDKPHGDFGTHGRSFHGPSGRQDPKRERNRRISRAK